MRSFLQPGFSTIQYTLCIQDLMALLWMKATDLYQYSAKNAAKNCIFKKAAEFYFFVNYLF